MVGNRTPLQVAFVDLRDRRSFMASDEACLRRSFDLLRLEYPGRPTLHHFRDCFDAARQCEVLYIFFASEHALVASLVFKALRRRIVLIPGGYDYACVPGRRYGLAARRRGWLPKLLGLMCDVALPVSRQMAHEFLALVPSAGSRTFVSYLGIDETEFGVDITRKVPGQVATIAYVDGESFSRKGIDRFLEAAAEQSDVSFIIGGRIEPSVGRHIERIKTPNVKCTGPLSHPDEVAKLLATSAVYAQLSWHESFGVAVAEAMLCGCVPVVGEPMALREVAGRWAVVVGGDETDGAAVRRALTRAETTDLERMRSEVAARFSMDRRTERLSAAVTGTLVPSSRSMSGREGGGAVPARTARGGWARTPLPISHDMLVLDVGSGGFPNDRANILCDRELTDNRHRSGLPIVVDRPLVLADATALPFRDEAFDFVIASHIAEHVDDPERLCGELARVAVSGYIETPSPLADVLFEEEYHLWRVGQRHGALTFTRKGQPSALLSRLTEPIYKLYYAGQPTRERPTFALPSGLLGVAVRLGLRVLGGVMNRTGVMTTRYRFSPYRPLRCSIR